MTVLAEAILEDVRIPRNLLSDPDFGGARDGDCQRGTLVLRGGRVAGLVAAAPTGTPHLIIPHLTEAHCHLDKCHSLHRMADVGGDLAAAIAEQGRDKVHWTEDDLSTRATQGLAELRNAGCRTVRSHIDWGETARPPLAWQVLPEIDAPDLNVQWAALTGIDQMANAAFARAVADAVAQTKGGVLGSFILAQSDADIQAGLRQCFAEADRLGLALDFHVDETLGPFNGVERITDMALETGFSGPILCGHAVALMDKSPDDFRRIADKLARAGITICALPTTNLYLQGRQGGTPDRRGITRLSELASAGVTVIVGSDNVADAFCPVGQHNPMAALHLACLAAHLDPPLARLLPMVTLDAERALGRDPVTVDTAHADDLLISSAAHIPALVAGHGDTQSLSSLIQSHPTLSGAFA